MLDDPRKERRREAAIAELVDAEIERVLAYARFLIEATPYAEKRVTIFPGLAHMSPSVTRAFERECRLRGMDLEYDGLTRTGELRIHAPPVGKKRQHEKQHRGAEKDAEDRPARAQLRPELGDVAR